MKITKIERVKHEPMPVYDLKVPGFNNFAVKTEKSTVVVHNSGKSTFCYQTSKMFLDKYGENAALIIVDSENSVDRMRLEVVFGITIGHTHLTNGKVKESKSNDRRVFLIPGPTLEGAASLIRGISAKLLEEGKYVLVIWDSITASQAAKDYEDAIEAAKKGDEASLNSGGMMLRARVLKSELNRLLNVMFEQPMTVLLINQATTQINRWGGSETSGGGYGKEHNIHYKVRFNFKSGIESELLGLGKGTSSEISIEKSKFGPRADKIEIFIHDDEGGIIVPDMEVLARAQVTGTIEGKGAWYRLNQEALPDLTDEEKELKWHGWDKVVEDASRIAPILKKALTRQIREKFKMVDMAYQYREKAEAKAA